MLYANVEVLVEVVFGRVVLRVGGRRKSVLVSQELVMIDDGERRGKGGVVGGCVVG